MKINFTQQHMDRLSALAVDFLFGNRTINNSFGSPLNIVELVHTTTIETLNKIKFNLAKQIERLEETDEWVSDDSSQRKLDQLKVDKELVNLIIGYKRFFLEKQSNAIKKDELQKQLNELLESKKTPEEKIEEIKKQIEELD